MTDHAKRASTGGRPPVATPKVNSSAGASVTSTETALSKALGAKATIKYRPMPNTTHTTTGYIDTLCPSTHHLIVRSRPNAGELRLISTDRILEYTILEPAKPETAPVPVITLSARDIAARVDDTLTKERSAREHQGQGVERGAQELYDAMRRLFPCKWSGKAFVLNDTALVEPPYGVENVRAVEGIKGAEKSLPYLKKALESERKKLADKANTAGTQSPMAGSQRKGG